MQQSAKPHKDLGKMGQGKGFTKTDGQTTLVYIFLSAANIVITA